MESTLLSSPMSSFSIPILIFSALLFFRVIAVALAIRRHRRSLKNRPKKKRQSPVKTLAVLGSGGHTTEMLTLLQDVDTKRNYNPLIFVVAKSDTTSEQRLSSYYNDHNNDDRSHHHHHPVWKIPRSREVGQSYFTSVGTTLISIFYALWMVGRIRPDLLLINGPGTCLPIALATIFYRILGLCEGNIVFVESFCRVTSLSLTGKILYPFADRFMVCWKELKEVYPHCDVISTFLLQD